MPENEHWKTSDIQCPFCKETDFDLIGLKLHLIMGYCQQFLDTPVVDDDVTKVKEE